MEYVVSFTTTYEIQKYVHNILVSYALLLFHQQEIKQLITRNEDRKKVNGDLQTKVSSLEIKIEKMQSDEEVTIKLHKKDVTATKAVRNLCQESRSVQDLYLHVLTCVVFILRYLL